MEVFENYDDDQEIFVKPRVQSKLEQSGFDDILVILGFIAFFAMLVCILR